MKYENIEVLLFNVNFKFIYFVPNNVDFRYICK